MRDHFVPTHMAERPNVYLTARNRPENLLLARQALRGFADAAGVEGVALADITTAVSEACTNVMLHAYDGAVGLLELELGLTDEGVLAVVRDAGVGIRPRVALERGGAHGGVGLTVILALAQSVEFVEPPGGGTEVRMEFACETGLLDEPPADRRVAEAQARFAAAAEDRDAVGVLVASPRVAARVLARVLCAAAARADFSTDGLADTEVLAEAIVGQCEAVLDAEYLPALLAIAPRSLSLRVGPLEIPDPAALAGTAGGSFALLIDRLDCETAVFAEDGGTSLEMRIPALDGAI